MTDIAGPYMTTPQEKEYLQKRQEEQWQKDQEEFEEDRKEEKKQPTDNVIVDSGSTTLVETLLLLLIIVNGFTSGQFKGLWGLMTLQNNADPQQFRQGFIVFGGELVLLVALSLAAKSSEQANKVVLAFIGTLWLGWFMHNRLVLASFVSKVLPAGKTIKQGGKLTTS